MSLSSVTAGLVIGFIYSWKITLLILAFMPFLIVSAVVRAKTQFKVLASSNGEVKLSKDRQVNMIQWVKKIV